MRFVLLFISTFLIVQKSNAQNTFPEAWLGEYSGKMVMTYVGRQNDTIDVHFSLQEIEADSIWSYTMSYKSEKWGDIVKDYRYVTVKKGEFTHFLFDELNGIKMEMTLMNDCFYGMYDVMDFIYVSTLCKSEEGLIFKLFGSPTTDPMVSKTEADEEGKTIEAKSMKPGLVQSAVLIRQ